MNWSDFATVGSFVVAGVALFYAIKKQPHEEAHLDSQTITNLIKSIKEQNDQYDELDRKFEDYKKASEKYRQDTEMELTGMRSEITKIRTENTHLSNENIKLRTWVEHLCEQLKGAKIKPVSE